MKLFQYCHILGIFMVGDRTYWKGNSPKFITLEDVDKLSSLASKHLHAKS